MAERKIYGKQRSERASKERSALLDKSTNSDGLRAHQKENRYKDTGFYQFQNISGKRIVRLLMYLICLYLLLFGMLTGLLIIVLQLIISEDKPYLTGQQSLLRLTPGLSYRPNIDFKTSLISYQSSDPQSYMPYVQNLRTFFYFYEDVNVKPQDGFATCVNGTKSPDIPNLVCKFYPIVLESCVKENNFGYDRSEPCIILKINRVYGWLPDIQNQTMSNSPLVRCFGRFNSDFGKLHYYPNVTIDGVTYGIFDSVYYPYIIQYAYRSPVVAVQVKQVQRNSLFFLTCRLFNLKTPSEPVNFEVLID